MPSTPTPASPRDTPSARLAPCRRRNCVSSADPRERYRMEPIAFEGPPAEAWRRLLEVVRTMPRARVVREAPGYLHAEVRSALFRFVDDVELVLDAAGRRIHFRSASRLGRRDFGVNRRRMEGIRSAFAAGPAGVRELRSRMLLPRPRPEVFAFFADAGNLQALTPAWLHFRILTRLPVELRPGAILDYRLRLRGVPITWGTEITAWEPPHRFVDEQRRGPYRLWVHEHTFEEADGGTLVDDRVRYAAPGGPWVDRHLVAPDLRKVFTYRQRKLRELFGGDPAGDGAVEIDGG